MYEEYLGLLGAVTAELILNRIKKNSFSLILINHHGLLNLRLSRCLEIITKNVFEEMKTKMHYIFSFFKTIFKIMSE